MTFLEKISLGLQTTLIGLAFVFVVLVILIGVVKLLKVFAENTAKIKAALLAPFRAIKKKITKNKNPKAKVVTTEVNDGEVIAAITAAISMMLATENVAAAVPELEYAHNRVKFLVRSIKEIK